MTFLPACACSTTATPLDAPTDDAAASVADVPLDGALTHRDAPTGDALDATDAWIDTAEAPEVCSPAAMGPTNAAVWETHVIDNAAYPDALCNDGSAPVFWIRRNPSSTRWVLMLHGGGFCHDQASCQARWESNPGIMRGEPRSLTGPNAYRGIFSGDVANALRDANMVRVQYCSSDLWSGDRGGTAHCRDLLDPSCVEPENGATWHFRGRRIADAVLSTLQGSHGFEAATDIVLAGESAGGGGVYVLLDDLAARMRHARVLGVPDAAFQWDFVTPPPGVTPLAEEVRLGHAMWGGRGDASCVGSTVVGDRHRCRSGVYLATHGHLRTRTLIVQQQYDWNLMRKFGVNVCHFAGGVCEFASVVESDYSVPMDDLATTASVAAAMRVQLGSVDPRHSIFASYGPFHGTLKDEPVSQIAGVSLREAINEWFADPCHPERRIEAPVSGLPGTR